MMITLENAVLRAQFDEHVGALVSLCSRATGWELLRRPELGMSFRMEVPLPARAKNYINGTEQAAPRVEIDADGHGVTFTWDGLTSQHGGEHAIRFTGHVTLRDDGLHFDSTVENYSTYTVNGVCYPCFGDITPADRSKKMERMGQSYNGMNRAPISPVFSGQLGYWGYDTPGNCTPDTSESLFTLLHHEDQGFYLGAHDPGLRELVQFFYNFEPGVIDSTIGLFPTTDSFSGHTVHTLLQVVHFPFVHPGARAELCSIVVQPYVGGWQAGADIYKAWRAEWFTRPTLPAWVAEPHSWLQIQMNGSEDDLRYRYTDLVDIGHECAENGVAAIQLVGWNNGGQDRGNPFHDTDPRLGTWEELRDAIAAVHAMGVKVILFSKFTWVDRSLPWFAEQGIKHTIKDPYGDAQVHSGYRYQTYTQIADINTRRFSPTCPLSAAWRAVAEREFTKLLDLGAAGMLFDESQHHNPARYCFDATHGHQVPAFVYAGDIVLARQWKAISDQRNPDFLYAGEGCYDVEFLEYHLSYFRLGGPQLHRYIDSQAPMMIAVTGFDDRNHLIKCLQYRYIISYEPFNFHGRLRDFPLTVAFGHKIDALRTRYRAYLWDGEYRDAVGAAVMEDGQPYTDYSVFRQPATGLRAVAIANMNPEQAVVVMVTLDGVSGTLTLVTPEAQEPVACDGTVTIPPRSLAVVLEGNAS